MVGGRGEPRAFPDTSWNLVRDAALRGSVESAAAMARLCEAYWYPLYYFLRRTGHSRDSAGDLVQGFFLRFLQADSLPRVDSAEGRFRSYLIGALRHFLADERDREQARRRDRRLLVPLELDLEEGEHRFRVEPSSDATPEQAYEKKWALALLARVLERLRIQYQQTGRSELFDQLSVYLPGGRDTPSYGEAAARTGLSLSAVKVAIHRLRARYRVALRREVQRTVSDRADVDREVRYLIEVLSR